MRTGIEGAVILGIPRWELRDAKNEEGPRTTGVRAGLGTRGNATGVLCLLPVRGGPVMK